MYGIDGNNYLIVDDKVFHVTPKFEVGDIVFVTDSGAEYTTYDTMYKSLHHSLNDYDTGLVTGQECKVSDIGFHPISHTIIYLVSNGNGFTLIDEYGLQKAHKSIACGLNGIYYDITINNSKITAHRTGIYSKFVGVSKWDGTGEYDILLGIEIAVKRCERKIKKAKKEEK